MKLVRLVFILLGFLSLNSSLVSCSINEELDTPVHATGDEGDDPVGPDEGN